MPLWQSPWTPRFARRVREGTGVLEKEWVVERARAWTDMVGVGCFLVDEVGLLGIDDREVVEAA